LVSLVAITGLAGGCGTTPYEFVLDGDWRVVSVGAGFGDACFRVTDGRIVLWDDTCAGRFLIILNNPVAARSGEQIVLLVDVIMLTGELWNFTLDLIVQPDGTMAGRFIVHIPGVGSADEPVIVTPI